MPRIGCRTIKLNNNQGMERSTKDSICRNLVSVETGRQNKKIVAAKTITIETPKPIAAQVGDTAWIAINVVSISKWVIVNFSRHQSLQFVERDNGNVHWAAEIIVSKSRAACGFVCTAFLFGG